MKQLVVEVHIVPPPVPPICTSNSIGRVVINYAHITIQAPPPPPRTVQVELRQREYLLILAGGKKK